MVKAELADQSFPAVSVGVGRSVCGLDAVGAERGFVCVHTGGGGVLRGALVAET